MFMFCAVSSDHILAQLIGDELLEQLQPHRRVKRREKILPGWFRTRRLDESVHLCCSCATHRDHLLCLSMSWLRWLFQSCDLSGRRYSGRVPDLLPDRTGHHKEASLLNATLTIEEHCRSPGSCFSLLETLMFTNTMMVMMKCLIKH